MQWKELRFQTLMLQQAERWQSSASSRCLLSPGCYFDQKQQKITLIKAQVGSQVSLITIISLTTFHLMERQVESVRWAKVSRPSSANLVSSLWWVGSLPWWPLGLITSPTPASPKRASWPSCCSSLAELPLSLVEHRLVARNPETYLLSNMLPSPSPSSPSLQ